MTRSSTRSSRLLLAATLSASTVLVPTLADAAPKRGAAAKKVNHRTKLTGAKLSAIHRSNLGTTLKATKVLGLSTGDDVTVATSDTVNVPNGTTINRAYSGLTKASETGAKLLTTQKFSKMP